MALSVVQKGQILQVQNFNVKQIHSAAPTAWPPEMGVAVFLSPDTISRQENSSVRASGAVCESQGWSHGARFPDVFSPGVSDPS